MPPTPKSPEDDADPRTDPRTAGQDEGQADRSSYGTGTSGEDDGFALIRAHHAALRGALGDAESVRAPNAARQARRRIGPLWAEHVRIHEQLRREAENAGFEDVPLLGEAEIEADLISLLLCDRDLGRAALEPGRIRVATRLIRGLIEREETPSSGLLDKVKAAGVEGPDLGQHLAGLVRGASSKDQQPQPRHFGPPRGADERAMPRHDAERGRGGYRDEPPAPSGQGRDRDDRFGSVRAGSWADEAGWSFRQDDDWRDDRRGGRDFRDDRPFQGSMSGRPESGGWARDDGYGHDRRTGAGWPDAGGRRDGDPDNRSARGRDDRGDRRPGWDRDADGPYGRPGRDDPDRAPRPEQRYGGQEDDDRLPGYRRDERQTRGPDPWPWNDTRGPGRRRS